MVPNYAFDWFNGCKKGGSLPLKNPCFIRKNLFFSILQKQLPLTLSKKQWPITIVPWHLDTNYIIFRNVEFEKLLFSKKKKL